MLYNYLLEKQHVSTNYPDKNSLLCNSTVFIWIDFKSLAYLATYYTKLGDK